MSSMCSKPSSKTWTPLPDRFIDEHLVEMFPLFDQAWLQLVNIMHPVAMLPPCLVVHRVQVRTIGWPHSWSDEVWCFTVSRALWAGALSCWKVKKSPDRSRMAGRNCMLMKEDFSIILQWPFTFVPWSMKNKSVCPLQTAHSNRHITDRENVERALTTQRHFRTSFDGVTAWPPCAVQQLRHHLTACEW